MCALRDDDVHDRGRGRSRNDCAFHAYVPHDRGRLSRTLRVYVRGDDAHVYDLTYCRPPQL